MNKDNPIAHLSMRQVDGIFGSERTGGWEINYGRPGDILFTAKYARGAEADIRKWGQLGLTGEWADKPIQTYGYAAPGFTAYFERRVLHWSDKWNPNYREYVEPKQAPEGGEGEAVFSVRPLEALTRDPYGIAWGAHFHAKEFPGLKELAIGSSDDGPFVPPTPETVRDRTYPLVRNVYVYLNRDPVRPMDPRVREFLRFVLSREGQAIIEKGGFYSPLTAAALQENLGKLE